ncbi:hypothetical protein PS914_05984 [Pseudomonas fluorescens]|uniref:hypothetical protein n=1 Tax=Pseudomonas fluorescens TaxID=294 RepID=UPI00123EEC6F|nr:hypothetical protein [Pseudomonas fluorescens]VVQ17250.1 hypothetical protein PS914_05984 [Pseudomonas fluorescens]
MKNRDIDSLEDSQQSASQPPPRKTLKTKASSMLRVAARYMAASVVLAAPIAAYQSGGAVLSNKTVDAVSCIAQHEFNFMGIFAFRYDSYDKECAEAKAVVTILNAGLALDDKGMVAASLTVWKEQFPRLNDAMNEIIEKLLKGTDIKKSP